MKENLINHNGCIFRKCKKVRAYTLIEVIASIAISTIVLTIGTTLLISSYKTYLNMIKTSIRQDEIDNALLSIDRILTGNMMIDRTFNLYRDEVLINYSRDMNTTLVKTKIITRNNEKLSVETHNLAKPKPTLIATNTILDKVENFEILQKGKVYYYKITLKTGDVIIQCI